jgi:Domain of unknown function (DUF4388)
MDFSGRLAAFPVSDLLQWAHSERCTGALVIRRSQREKRIFFHAGEVVGCLSDDPAEYYGQYLVLHGHLKEDQLFEAISLSTSKGIRLGAAILELGLLDPGVVQRTLRAQIEDALCDLFLWERGIFYFQAEMPQEDDILPEPINVMGLMMEGTRWKDEVYRIRRVLVHDGMVLRRGERFPGGDGLSPVQRRIVKAVDGRKTLGELYQSVRGAYFRFLEGAFRLCVEMVLDIEKVGDPVEMGTHEMSVYDLLLETAAEEQALVARRHMAVPLDLLERSYPVWVAEPGPEERTRMPERARDFYARFDGRTSLGEAFSGDVRQRGREMDLLLLQLQKGRLALLPLPLDRLEEESQRASQPPRDRWWRRVFRQAS